MEKLPPILWLEVSSEAGHQFKVNRTPAPMRKQKIVGGAPDLRFSCQIIEEREALFQRNGDMSPSKSLA